MGRGMSCRPHQGPGRKSSRGCRRVRPSTFRPPACPRSASRGRTGQAGQRRHLVAGVGQGARGVVLDESPPHGIHGSAGDLVPLTHEPVWRPKQRSAGRSVVRRVDVSAVLGRLALGTEPVHLILGEVDGPTRKAHLLENPCSGVQRGLFQLPRRARWPDDCRRRRLRVGRFPGVGPEATAARLSRRRLDLEARRRPGRVHAPSVAVERRRRGDIQVGVLVYGSHVRRLSLPVVGVGVVCGERLFSAYLQREQLAGRANLV